MKILHVIDQGYIAGGAEKSVDMIKRDLLRRGHDVRILSTTKNLNGKQSYSDFTVPHIDGNGLQKILRHAWHHSVYKQTKQILTQFQPDIVHLHVIGEFSPALLFALGKLPIVLTVHGPEEYSRKLLQWQLPSTDYKNGSYKFKDLKPIGYLRLAHYSLVQRPLFLNSFRRRLRRVIVPSNYMATMIKADFKHVAITQIYNGIDLPAPRPMPANKRILFVGRLTAVKGIHELVDAFKTVSSVLPDAQLLLVGDGEAKKVLEENVKYLKLETKVKFAGWLDQAQIFKAYANSRLVVIPSIWPENLATVCIEAMAVGRPVIGTKVGGIPEMVRHGKTGMLVEPGNSKQLADSITELLKDGELCEAMSKSAVTASKNFSIYKFTNLLEKLYVEVLN
jgi:glycosyltransferase involved in cell wall biosynthesis